MLCPPANKALFNARNISVDFFTSLFFDVNRCTALAPASRLVGRPCSSSAIFDIASEASSLDIPKLDITFGKLFKVSTLAIALLRLLPMVDANFATPLAIKLPAATVNALPNALPVCVPLAFASASTLFKLALTSLPSNVNLITASPTCVAIIYLPVLIFVPF